MSVLRSAAKRSWNANLNWRETFTMSRKLTGGDCRKSWARLAGCSTESSGRLRKLTPKHQAQSGLSCALEAQAKCKRKLQTQAGLSLGLELELELLELGA